ncbi:MAG: Rrf2 family transcriptional regulator [Acidobacteriota bacterium]
MKLSTQEEYGLRCLLRVGRAFSEGSVTIPELARAEGMSEPNVAKMMRVLRRGGFVRSTRGQSGGYSLARSPEQIAVGHVLAVLGGRIFDSNFCGSHAGTGNLSCAHMGDCSIRAVWQTIQSAIDGVLAQLSLRELLQSEREMNVWATAKSPRLPVLEHRA